MLTRMLAQERQGLDGIIYLLLALVWLVVQVFSTISRKARNGKSPKKVNGLAPSRRGPGAARPPAGDRETGADSGRPVSRTERPPPAGEDSLLGFLRQLVDPSEAAPPPTPRKPAPAHAQEIAGTRQAIPFRERVHPDSRIPDAQKRSGSERPDEDQAIRNAVIAMGAVPFLSEVPWTPMSLGSARGMFPVAQEHGRAARSALQRHRTRARVRDAVIWKTVLDAPRAVVPPGRDVIGFGMQ